jgi:hypothetical protein
MPYSTKRSMRERLAITRGERTRRPTPQRLNVAPPPAKVLKVLPFQNNGPPYSDYDIPEPTNTFEDEEIRHVQPGWPAEGRDNAAITTFHS